MKTIATRFPKVFEKESGLHIFFVGGLLLVFVIILFSSRYAVSLLPRAVFSFSLLLACAYTGRWIGKRWLLKDHWIVMALLFAVFTVFYAMLGIIGYAYLLNVTIDSDNARVFFVGIPGFVFLFLFGGGFVAISRSARRAQIHASRVGAQQQESELALLRSQISPHFLFNTLNNLYGLSLTHQEKIPDLLLQLSDLLRYSVYDTGQQWVLLEDELAYIRNYIALEKIRINDRLELHVQMDSGHGRVKIAQLLLIMFVENAFKHSRNTLEPRIRIDIDLCVVEEDIICKIGNSCKTLTAATNNSGVGIDNAVKRLDLLYPGAYSLTRRQENNYYYVELRLKAK